MKHPFDKPEHQDKDYAIFNVHNETGEAIRTHNPTTSYMALTAVMAQMKPFEDALRDQNPNHPDLKWHMEIREI